MAITKKAQDAQETDNNKNTYDGKKDEYGGIMSGTGYGRQAKEKKDKKKASVDSENKANQKENLRSKGFNEGLGQGSGRDTSKPGKS